MIFMALSEEEKTDIRRKLRNSSLEKEKGFLRRGTYDTTPEIKEIVEDWVFSHEKIADIDRKDESLELMREASRISKEANKISAKANTRALIALGISVTMLFISALTYLAGK